MKQYESGEDFLNKIYPNLNQSEEVKHIGNFANKEEAVKKYLERLNTIHNKAFLSNRENDRNLLKHFYYEKYVIKEEAIKENYISFLDKQYFDTYGIHMTQEMKEEHIKTIIEDQKTSLSLWIDYLSSEDAKFYPMWAKYWAFQGMLKIGGYDNQNGIYKKRDASTIAPFIELNQEVLAKCIDYIKKYVEDNQLSKTDIDALVSQGNFFKMYTILFGEIKKISFDKTSINGIWVKYNQGNDYLPLYNSLQGYGTGWCTAGEDTCKKQIAAGDFYVYYTYDTEGQAKVPRIAIRMDGQTRIGEIRGVATGQNVESHLESVLEEKLKEFPDRDKYNKRIEHAKKLTILYAKYQRKEEFTKEELSFLYEVKEKIEGFGYDKDPRIKEIKSDRNSKKDYATIYHCNEDEIALSQSEFKQNPKQFKVLFDDLDLSGLTSAEGLVFPSIMNGNLDLSGLTSAEGLSLPSTINGYLDLRRLTSAEGLVLPNTMNGYLGLKGLTSAKGLVLPSTMNGSLDLRGLTSAEGLVLLSTMNGDLDLSGLTSSEGLVLPSTMNGSLDLRGLTSAEGLVLPSTMNGSLDLRELTNAKGLELPNIINGTLNLSGLTSAEGLVLPTTMNGDLDLRGLTSAEGLVLPTTMNGSLYLSGLTSAEGLVLPSTMNGTLDLRELTSAEGLVLPSTMNGNLNLNGLTSAEGLVLPGTMNGGLALRGLTSADGLILPDDFDLKHLICPDFVKEELMKRRKGR